MTHPSKSKGNTFERELVNGAREKGLVAERAYASNGKALGHGEEVDCVVAGCRIQAKRRRKLPNYLRVPDGTDATVFREDRGETYALLRWADLLDILSANGW